jgi:CRP/FNR family transcriptional regulator, nitrogen oxide reductase regulator
MSGEAKFDRSRLADLPAFQGLSGDECKDLLQRARMQKLEKGAALFEQGDDADRFFVLADGRLKVTQVTPDGQQVVVRYIGPGEMFGCVAVTGQQAYPGTASAALDSTVVAWSASEAAGLVEKHPRFGAHILRMMSGRVQEAHARMREMATERVERRVARALLRLAREAGKRTEAGIEIAMPLSRQDVAEMTGTTLYTVSRLLSAWEQDGLVEAGRQRVVIKKPHELVKVAEDLPDPA